VNPRVLGIDSSATGTGLCWGTEPEQRLTLGSGKLKEGERLAGIYGRTMEALKQAAPHLVVLEGYSYGSISRYSKPFQIGEAAGINKLAIQHYFDSLELPALIVTVSPMGRAQYGAGKGGAKKAEVVKLWSRTTGQAFADDNQVDAHILHEIGMRLLGAPGVLVQPDAQLALKVLREKQGKTINLALQRTAQEDG
jgi:hypothetical protein